MIGEKSISKSRRTGIEKLKEDYEVLRKKYNLPNFKFMNETFEIETIDSESTVILLKRIRKNITEKISSGLRALEIFLNPQPSPLFILKIIKTISDSDKKIISELYNRFAEYEIEAFGLENEYHEQKEADFIVKVADEWKENSNGLNQIYNFMKQGHTKESQKKEKSYFG